MALGRRQPTGELLHHADHGCQGQYTSVEFTNRLADWGVAGSYGSVGDCFDCEDPAVEIGPVLGGSRLSLARVA
jgi:hypothetical protein